MGQNSDPRETQLDVPAKNRVAIFYENGGPEKISIKELDNTKQSELNAGEVLVRVSLSPSVPSAVVMLREPFTDV